MFNKKFFFFLILIVLLFQCSFLFSQPSIPKELAKISFTMFSSETGYSDLEQNLMDKLQASLKNNGLFSIDNFQIELLLGIKKIDETNKIAISVAELIPLSEEQIQKGKNVEMFYSSKDNKNNLSEDGKSIRKYVSEEYLKQFRTVVNNKIEIIELSDLDSFVQKLVSKYL